MKISYIPVSVDYFYKYYNTILQLLLIVRMFQETGYRTLMQNLLQRNTMNLESLLQMAQCLDSLEELI